MNIRKAYTYHNDNSTGRSRLI